MVPSTTPPQIIKIAKWIAKNYGVKLYCPGDMLSKMGIRGLALSWKNIIYVDKNQPLVWFTSTLFHEIQHCLNHRNRKYWNFHKGNASRKDLKRLGFRAELYTDRQAKKLAAKEGFHQYKMTYSNTKYWKRIIREWYDR